MPRRRSRGPIRKEDADGALRHLSVVLEKNLARNPKLADIAARQILSIGKKHGARPGPDVRRRICRTCKKSMLPGLTSRTRIYSKSIISTCLRCGRINRQGPDFGGSRNG